MCLVILTRDCWWLKSDGNHFRGDKKCSRSSLCPQITVNQEKDYIHSQIFGTKLDTLWSVRCLRTWFQLRKKILGIVDSNPGALVPKILLPFHLCLNFSFFERSDQQEFMFKNGPWKNLLSTKQKNNYFVWEGDQRRRHILRRRGTICQQKENESERKILGCGWSDGLLGVRGNLVT